MKSNNARRKSTRRRVFVVMPPALDIEFLEMPDPPVPEIGEGAEYEEIMRLLGEMAKGNWPPAKK